MNIGGVQKLSLVDYPGKTAAAIFTIGCNMRCGYCHNPELVLPEQYAESIPEEDVLTFLASRVGKLEGVVISGGEPTVHADLPDFIARVKDLGFAVKLDSNGTHPDMLRQLYADHLIDYVSMDIKGTLASYQAIAAYPIDMGAIIESIETIKNSGVDYEFRTTVVRSQIPVEDFAGIGQLVQGASRFALQKFRPGITVSPAFRTETTYSDEEFEDIKHIMEQYVEYCVVR